MSLQSTMTSKQDVSIKLAQFIKTPLYSWHFVSFAFPQAFQNDGKPHDILCISSITVRKSLKVRSLSKSFNQMSTDNLFSFELVDVQKSFYLLKKCITLKHTCANNFLYIFFIIVYFHFISMFSREKSLQISLLAVSWLWRRHHHLL